MLELYLKKPYELELRNVETMPELKEDDVKVKVIYGGICGSDLSVFKGKLGHAAYPLRPGHELVGHIIEAGSRAEYAIGTRVVVVPNTFCGHCDHCLSGRTNICLEKKSIGVNVNGGFSEEFVIPSKYVMQIPDGLPDEKAVLIEPLAVVVHALKKVNITQSTTVAVVGCGNEGMLSVALANHLGAHVTAIDINPLKHKLIKNLGRIEVFHPNDVQGKTFDVVIEAAGVKEAAELGVQLVKKGGAMVMIGLTPEANIPIVRVVRDELTLYGSIIYNIPDDYQRTMDYLMDSNFNVTPIISRFLPFTECKEAYELALSGNYGKIVLDFKSSHS